MLRGADTVACARPDTPVALTGADRGALPYMLKKFRQLLSPPFARRPRYFTDCFPCCPKSHRIDGALVRDMHKGA